MLVIVAIVSGVNIFDLVGKDTPNWWSWCTSNKIYACLVVFFGSNMVEGMLISTGAFELLFNGKILTIKLFSSKPINYINDLSVCRYTCMVKIGNW